VICNLTTELPKTLTIGILIVDNGVYMGTISFEDSPEIKNLLDTLMKTGLFKSKSEIIRESIREISIKYGVYPRSDIRKLMDTKIKGKLSKTVEEGRAE
jgi:Arc/MetJ-type ribon-helix-helix transcriptional regulator